MESQDIQNLVEDVFEFRNRLQTPEEIMRELGMLGMSVAEVEGDKSLVFEAGIARNIRRACQALEIPISPHQSLTLAKHMRVGKEHYRNGVPLSDAERKIALRLMTIRMECFCKKEGLPFTEAERTDCERMVRFGERGLHAGHRIGEASGCFQSALVLGCWAVLVIVVISALSTIG